VFAKRPPCLRPLAAIYVSTINAYLIIFALLPLTSPQVILNPHLFHGAFLLDPATKANVMLEVRGLVIQLYIIWYHLL
jgi:hypothetical protein